MGLIEIVIAMPIVLIALGVLVQMLSSGAGLRQLGREQWHATNAAQTAIERIRNEGYRDIFALYNEDPLDDPLGPGTAPGHRFPVEGLVSLDPDGMVGEIRLPLVNVGSNVAPLWQVREDVVDDVLGMPRDLNGDSVVDSNDHSIDYTILPVEVVLRWQGKKGERELRFVTVLTELYR